jgi:glycosyltransferase involved in cell wall biosynthesis
MNHLNHYPRITIVTVTYNAKQHLEKTIKSVIEQDHPNIEYIIIDGASADGTIDIIKKYGKHISYWVSESDSGIYDAMNKGIDAATGEWINFLNAGDTFCSTNTISTLSQYFKKRYDLVHGLMYRNKPKRELTAPYHSQKNPLDGCFIWHPTLFTKTKIMKKHKFDVSFKIAGDYNFFLQCLKANYNIKFIDMPIVDYMENGISQSNSLVVSIEAIFAQTKYLKNANKLYESAFFHNCFLEYPKKKNLLSILLNRADMNLIDVLKDKKFILYGYGNFGINVFGKYKEQVIMIVDKNYQKLNKKYNLSIRTPNELYKTHQEYIFVSVLGQEKEIIDELSSKFNINKKRFLYVSI